MESRSTEYFPKWKYHAQLAAVIVHSADEETALGEGWADSPAAFGIITHPEAGHDSHLDKVETEQEKTPEDTAPVGDEPTENEKTEDQPTTEDASKTEDAPASLDLSKLKENDLIAYIKEQKLSDLSKTKLKAMKKADLLKLAEGK